MEITFINNSAKKSQHLLKIFLLEWNDENDYVIQKTSGSTGPPKEIKILKKSMVDSAMATGTFFGFKKNQNLLLCLSPEFIAGKMQIVRAKIFKMNLLVGEFKGNPLSNIEVENKIHFAAFVPFQVHQIIKDKQSQLQFENIENVIIGGGVVSDSLRATLSDFKNKNYSTFGMTETVSHIALCLIYENNAIYKSMPDVEFGIDDRGCLIINAPKLNSSPIITNDIVDLINKESFKWFGRYDNVINTGGIKIYPEVLEKKIKDLISERFYFKGEIDSELGEKVVLFIEDQNIEDEAVAALKIKINKYLSKFEQPKAIKFLLNFNETATGKIIR